MVHISSSGIPASPFNGRASRSTGKSWRLVLDVEPKVLPVDNHAGHLIRDVLRTYTPTQLQTRTSHYIYFGVTRLGFQVEEVLEKIKMGFDPQKSFTKMDKNRNVKDRIRGQVMRLNPPVMQRPRKKSEVGIPRLRRT